MGNTNLKITRREKKQEIKEKSKELKSLEKELKEINNKIALEKRNKLTKKEKVYTKSWNYEY